MPDLYFDLDWHVTKRGGVPGVQVITRVVPLPMPFPSRVTMPGNSKCNFPVEGLSFCISGRPISLVRGVSPMAPMHLVLAEVIFIVRTVSLPVSSLPFPFAFRFTGRRLRLNCVGSLSNRESRLSITLLYSWSIASSRSFHPTSNYHESQYFTKVRDPQVGCLHLRRLGRGIQSVQLPMLLGC